MDERLKELMDYITDRDLTQTQIDIALVYYYNTDLTPAQIFLEICKKSVDNQ